jgi:hypothetical protein
MLAMLVVSGLSLVASAPGSSAPSEAKLDCHYSTRPSAKQPAPEIEPHPGCGSRSADGTIKLSSATLSEIDFDAQGLARVAIDAGSWLYVRRTGAVLEVLAVDNGPDDFAEGLVRGLRDGKVVYFDRSFKVVIGPKYDFGWPFEHGRAMVCVDCHLSAPSASQCDEHIPVLGGRWGFIDHRGREVVPVQSTRDQLLRLDH